MSHNFETFIDEESCPNCMNVGWIWIPGRPGHAEACTCDIGKKWKEANS